MGKHSKKRQFNMIGVQEAANVLGISLHAMYNMIWDRKILPDIILWKNPEVGRRPEVQKYLFSMKHLIAYKKKKTGIKSTVDACKILGITRCQLYFRIAKGEIVPDVVTPVKKGHREYHTFGFTTKTLNTLKSTLAGQGLPSDSSRSLGS